MAAECARAEPRGASLPGSAGGGLSALRDAGVWPLLREEVGNRRQDSVLIGSAGGEEGQAPLTARHWG